MNIELVDKSDPILREKMPECDVDVMPMFKSLFDPLHEFMLEHSGMGLAANQVGFKGRFFIMMLPEGGWDAFINPVITQSSGRAREKEHCLSYGGKDGKGFKIRRKQIVTVKYIDKEFKEQEKTFDGWHAICVQHEIDHLDGIRMEDRFNEQQAKKNRFLKKRF